MQAQRGGGHGGGGGGHAMSGGHAGFSGGSGFSGRSGGFRGSSGGHSISGLGARSFRGSSLRGSSLGRSSPAARSFHRGFNRGLSHDGNIRLRTYGYGNCYGYACRGYGYPWGYGGFYDPYWWWDSGSSYDDNSNNYEGNNYEDQQDANGLANEMNGQGLGNQQGDPDSYARTNPPQHRAERTEAAPATILVFRDQHKEEVQNYAIVGQTLWNFAPQRTEKIPLDDIDIPATTKTNEDRGVDFRVPVMQGRLTLQIQSVD